MPARALSRNGLPPRKAAPESTPGETAPSPSVLDLFEGELMDGETTLKLEALAALHERKVATLMKSIGSHKDEIKKLKAQSKEHRRSQLIQELRGKLREQELAVDVLKEALVEGPRGALSADQVNELVICRTLGGPKRFRPKTREELQNELAAATRRNDALAKRAERSEARAKEAWAARPAARPRRDEREAAADGGGDDAGGATPALLRDGSGPEELPSAAHLREVGELTNRLEEAEVGISRRELRIAEQRRETDGLRAAAYAAERALDKLRDERRDEGDARQAAADARSARDASERRAAELEGEVEKLRLELEHATAAHFADEEALRHDLDVLRDELSSALANEAELQSAVRSERERAGRAAKAEVGAKHDSEARVASAERALRDAVRLREKLEAKYDARERDVVKEREALRLDHRRALADESRSAKRRVDEVGRAARADAKDLKAAQDEARVATAKAEILQGHVDALHHELRASADARADERAADEASKLALTEKVGALERALATERGKRDVEQVEIDLRADRLSREALNHKARADHVEAEIGGERDRRAAAQKNETKRAAEAALFKKRMDECRLENSGLRAKLRDAEAKLGAAAQDRAVAEHRATEALLLATQRGGDDGVLDTGSTASAASALTPVQTDDELYATRAALAAHMKLADAYANASAVKAAPRVARNLEEAHRRALDVARRELERALASSRPLAVFYGSMLTRIEARQVKVPLAAPAEPPSRRNSASSDDRRARPAAAKTPKAVAFTPATPAATQRLHHHHGTHVSRTPGAELAAPTPAVDGPALEVKIRGLDDDRLREPDTPLDDRYLGDDDGLEFSEYSQGSASSRPSRRPEPSPAASSASLGSSRSRRSHDGSLSSRTYSVGKYASGSSRSS